DLRRVGSHPPLVSVPASFQDVAVELCYLPADYQDYDQRHEEEPYSDADLAILRHLDQMEKDSGPMQEKDRRHYADTRAAIERMRTVLSRQTNVEQARLNETETRAQHALHQGIVRPAGG